MADSGRRGTQLAEQPPPEAVQADAVGPGARRRASRAAAADQRPQRVAWTVAGAVGFWGVMQLFWPAPLGVWVQGMVIGGLTALIAFGIALVYRANRIVNFAAGDMGAAPAALAVLLIVGPGWPYFVAMPVGILVGLALGAVVELCFIRRFFRSPRLILTVATIGVSQLLMGVGLILPSLFDMRIPPQSFPSPFDFSLSIHPIIFRGNDVLAMVVIPVVIVGLAAFFRYTSVGIAVRASADSTDRAFLVGIPVKRIQMIVWVLAAGLATVALILRAGIVGLPIGSVLGPAVLLRALAAAVIGRMQNLPVIFVAAVALGVVEQSIIWHTGRGLLVAPILFGTVLVALLLQRRGQTARAEEASAWQAAAEARPVPRELRDLPPVRTAFRALAGGLAVLLLILPALVPESRTNLFAVVFLFAIIGVSLVVLTGWAGQVSLGQFAFVGVGAAVAGALTTRVGLDLGVAVILAGFAGAAVAVLIGIPALRIRGFYLAVTTLAFALAASHYFLNRAFFDWWLPEGRVTRGAVFGLVAVESETRYYYLCLAGLLLALAAARGLRRSRAGRVMIAIRENERAAQAYGVNATRTKLAAFALSGFLAAFAGALYVHHQQVFGTFDAERSIFVFTMVVIGGLTSIPGALLGATFVFFVQWVLPPAFRFLSTGVGMLLILMLFPAGLGGLMYQLRDAYLRVVANRAGIHVPSLVADRRQDDPPPDIAIDEVAAAGGTAAPAGHGPTPASIALDAGVAGNGAGRRRPGHRDREAQP